MGNCNFKTEHENDNITGKFVILCSSAITKNHFFFHYPIGRGGFGKVWKVELKKIK